MTPPYEIFRKLKKTFARVFSFFTSDSSPAYPLKSAPENMLASSQRLEMSQHLSSFVGHCFLPC
jgi:hypothetical protein